MDRHQQPTLKRCCGAREFHDHGKLWQCNWLEEIGTICSLAYDITVRTTHDHARIELWALKGSRARHMERRETRMIIRNGGHWRMVELKATSLVPVVRAGRDLPVISWKESSTVEVNPGFLC